MNLKKLININFWRFDHKHYKDLYDYDIRFNASFRNTDIVANGRCTFTPATHIAADGHTMRQKYTVTKYRVTI